MRNRNLIVSFIMLFCFITTGCSFNSVEEKVSVTKTYIDDNGDLIVVYSNGQVENAGHIKDPVNYTVTFDSNGGSYVETQYVKKGGYIVKPDNPTKIGFDFITWVDETNTPWLFNSKTVEKDLTLYAVWDKIPVDESKVIFWSCYGGTYIGVLDDICAGISSAKGIEIEHKSQHSYDNILSEMTSAIALEDYPYLAQGYPDHFATYLSAGILNHIDSFLTDGIINDYYDAYMVENKFYEPSGKAEHIYALPFNKSTEVLGYNGVFVDYCATINPQLAILPRTWEEWAGAKGQQYNAIFQDLITNSKKIYGKQDENGHLVSCSLDGSGAGEKLLLEFKAENADTSRLMSWDATDNAFITLTRQWDAEYTSLPAEENSKPINRRAGHIRFTEANNKAKVVQMLKFFNALNKQKMFGVPAELGNNYSSEAFANNKVMFMVCSSGGLSYNNTEGAWNRRFRIAPIPYKDDSHKFVMSRGANICMTDKGDPEKNFAVMTALTSGEFQAEWCLQTGYYPSSKSATNNAKYQAFLTEEKYPESAEGAVTPTRVAYREGSKVNSDHYMNDSENWLKFVDPAFVGSSEIRNSVKLILRNVFADIDEANFYNTAKYEEKIEGAITSTIKDTTTIVIDR